MARRARVGRRGAGIGTIITSALATLIAFLIVPRFIPANFALGGSLIAGGAAAYALDGKTTGEALVGAGIGLLALPLVSGLLAPQQSSTRLNVWG